MLFSLCLFSVGMLQLGRLLLCWWKQFRVRWVGVFRLKVRDGVMFQCCLLICLCLVMLLWWVMRLRWKVVDLLSFFSGWLVFRVRCWQWFVFSLVFRWVKVLVLGCLLIMLMLLLLVLVLLNIEFGFLIIFIVFRLNRLLWLVWVLLCSLFICMLVLVLKLWMLMLLLELLLFLLVLKVMLEMLDSIWCRFRVFCFWIIFCGIIVMVCGVFSSGMVYLVEVECLILDEVCLLVIVLVFSFRGLFLCVVFLVRVGEEQVVINSISGVSGCLVGKGDGLL